MAAGTMDNRRNQLQRNTEKLLGGRGVIEIFYLLIGPSLVAQPVKNLPAMRETWFPSQGLEGPLEKGMAAHSSILAWRIPYTV